MIFSLLPLTVGGVNNGDRDPTPGTELEEKVENGEKKLQHEKW